MVVCTLHEFLLQKYGSPGSLLSSYCFLSSFHAFLSKGRRQSQTSQESMNNLQIIKEALPRLILPTSAPPLNDAFAPRRVHLTGVDTIAPKIVEPVVLTFRSAPWDISSVLRSSLSSTLGYYKEWAGRISIDKDIPCIDFTDEGVSFYEAHAGYKLADHMMLGHCALEKLMPVSMSKPPPPELLQFKLTRFLCGGIALGLGRHHYVTDAHGFVTFLNNWADVTRGLPMPIPPIHDRSLLMPSNVPPRFPHSEYPVTKFASLRENPSQLCRAEIAFRPEQLSLLREECGGTSFFTTLELLYAHIWRSITRARGSEVVHKETMLVCPINGRSTLGIPDSYLGNVVFIAKTRSIAARELGTSPLSHAAALVKEGMRKTNTKDYMLSAVEFLEHGNLPQISGRGILGAWKPPSNFWQNSIPKFWIQPKCAHHGMGTASLV